MTDDQSEDPQREVERLAAELARSEREIEELKRESSRTKKVADDLWTHAIYLRARKKLVAGAMIVLGALGLLGLATVAQLYARGVEYVDGEMKDAVKSHIDTKVGEMIEDAKTTMNQKVLGMIEEAGPELDKQVNQQIGTLVEQKRKDIDSLIKATEEDVAMILSKQAQEAKDKVKQLIEGTEQTVKDKIVKLEKSLQEMGDDLSERAHEIQSAMLTSGEAIRVETMLAQGGAACDPNNLDDSQVALIGIRQVSTQIDQPVAAKRKIFRNTLFLDVHRNDKRDNSLADETCILAGVDRVVYRADPNYYRPSKFVRIDRETKFLFTISGWGTTKITADVYFIGRRYSTQHEGRLSIGEISDSDKWHLGDTPPVDF